MVFLGLDEHGFNATLIDEQGPPEEVLLRSARAFYEFLHYFEDYQFIFARSLNTCLHPKLWVRQALKQLNYE